MLELLLLLPLFMIGVLDMTFQVSLDEITDVRRDSYLNYHKYDEDRYRTVDDKVHQFYARMLDESENEIEVEAHSKRKGSANDSELWRPFSQEGQCNIRRIQMMHNRCSCRKPRERCVKIERPENGVVSVMPECAVVKRCEGVCPSTKTCRPTAVKMVQIPVIYLNLLLTHLGTDVVPECSVVEVEEHLKCRCTCSLQKEDCNQVQVFNPGMCRCECRESKRAELCNEQNKFWDSSTCECICPPGSPQICSSGAFFHTGLCRCIPISEKYPQSRGRRRPPV